MRIAATLTLSLVASFAVGCDRTTPVEPTQAARALAASHALADAAAGKPDIDPSYANGQTVYMIGSHLIVNARQTMPNLYEHAEELYLLVFPQQGVPAPGAGPITLPSGYEPQCNPCFHPGLPAPFVYHDHVLAGAPGMGNDGTAGLMKGPWKIILLMYNPAYVASSTFTPLKSEDQIDAAELAGVFLPINPGGANPYEVETGNVLICPVVSPHA